MNLLYLSAVVISGGREAFLPKLGRNEPTRKTGLGQASLSASRVAGREVAAIPDTIPEIRARRMSFGHPGKIAMILDPPVDRFVLRAKV
jgi:hypothetical protein